jgi:SPP1 family predicted phage head-tail adaptor
VRAGLLRHRVHLQRRETGFDDYGQPIEGWTTYATTQASVDPISGQEFLALLQAGTKVTHRVRLRYRPGVSSADRVLFNGRVLDVQVPLNMGERNKEIEFLCEERTDEH